MLSHWQKPQQTQTEGFKLCVDRAIVGGETHRQYIYHPERDRKVVTLILELDEQRYATPLVQDPHGVIMREKSVVVAKRRS
jgi:hypothetical protein